MNIIRLTKKKENNTKYTQKCTKERADKNEFKM